MAVAAALAGAVVLLAGCSTTVEGTPRAESFDGSIDSEFTDLLTECDAVADDTIAETVGGDAIARGFFGAICRWDVAGGDGIVKVTFNWFENGSLEVEREANEGLEYTVSDITVQGRRALRTQPPADPASCGVTAGSPDSGIVGWWVQYEPGSPTPDPCEAALALMDLTIDVSR
ncbi:MAG: DUF3558 domain-containing protein [Rhodococcus sp. (in: high G+C Gram-positive bacteria)]|uniref:DUF3558 domain-containing protein n=1 Tax=Rhodococcoides yunnanense TaxID=278209 RepID=UPI0022B1725F|nr:DUF3558 domain-containing protein [Rhodococcus yunnanensis]MCZ4278070.1 DUF3558 domain-containing protein [Rhodococcus yunnanensis]